jgi:hypothetical protein
MSKAEILLWFPFTGNGGDIKMLTLSTERDVDRNAGTQWKEGPSRQQRQVHQQDVSWLFPLNARFHALTSGKGFYGETASSLFC